MRRFFLVISSMLLASANSAHATSLSTEEILQLKKEIEGINWRSIHPLGGGAAYQYGIGFDPSVLSAKDARFVYAVTKDEKKNPELNAVISNGTETDRFYCEQAIWETYPVPAEDHAAKYTLYELDANGPVKANFTEFIHHRNSNRVSLHLIPAYVLRYQNAYDNLYHSKENVVEIDKKNLNNPALNDFRKEWAEFFRKTPRPSHNALIQERSKLKRKHENLFVS